MASMSQRWPALTRSRSREEAGISIVEVLIAAIVLTLSALAVLTLASSATRNTFRSEQSQVVVNRLQDELEHIRQLPYAEVALTAPPQHSSEVGSPAQRVSTDGTHFALSRTGSSPKRLAYAGGLTPDGEAVGCGATGQPSCGIDPGPQSFQSGDVSGKIYRYVAYPGVPADCTGCSADDLKRVVVAIRLDTTAAGGSRTYQELQSNVANPDAVPSSNPVDPTQTTDHQIATFSLTDTPCNNTSRVPPTTNHFTHNTRGTCENGGQTGEMRGAPDLMLTDRETGSDSDPTYDYSQDVTRDESPSPYGLAMLPTQSTPDCALQVLSGNAPNQMLDLPLESNRQLKTHTWLSNELNSTFAGLESVDSTLELWTKSVGGTAYQGEICVYVFKRITVSQQLPGLPATNLVVDDAALIDNAVRMYQPYSKLTWPQQWTRISVPMHLQMNTVTSVLNRLGSQLPGTLVTVGQPRLGVAITVDGSGTSGEALEFMYDHATLDSRFELDTPRGICVVPCGP